MMTSSTQLTRRTENAGKANIQTKNNVSNSSSIPAHNSNGINVVQKRRCQAPTFSSGDGCQSPLRSRLMRKGVPWPVDAVPAPRLVGIELNPGPKTKARKAAAMRVKRKPKQQKKKPQMRRRNGVPNSLGPAKRNKGSGGSRMAKMVPLHEEEYVGDVVLSSAGFVNTQYAINPGNAVLFPWLSTIAANFNKYRFQSLRFRYEPITSGYATAGQTGDIIFSLNPDASDPAPVAQAQVYDLQMKQSGMPCDNFTLHDRQGESPIVMAELNKQDSYYVRVGAAPANTDIKTYDVGTLNLSTIGTATSGTCGKLFVEYTVLLHSPVLVQPATGGVVHFYGPAPTTGNNFASAVLKPGGTPALSGITLGTNTILFPAGIPGNYLVFLGIYGSTSVTSPTAPTLTAGATAFSIFAADQISTENSAASTVATYALMQSAITVANSGGTYTLGTPSTIVGGSDVDIFIVSLPVSVLTMTSSEKQSVLENRLKRMEMLMDRMSLAQTSLSDDEFDFSRSSSSTVKTEEECKTTVLNGSSSSVESGSDLSKSTLGLIGELITRKSRSTK
jgi:hypothetical protein